MRISAISVLSVFTICSIPHFPFNKRGNKLNSLMKRVGNKNILSIAINCAFKIFVPNCVFFFVQNLFCVFFSFKIYFACFFRSKFILRVFGMPVILRVFSFLCYFARA